MTLSFDHKTYARLLNESASLAATYRKDCGLDKPVPTAAEILKAKAEKTPVVEEKVKTPTKVVEEKTEEKVEKTPVVKETKTSEKELSRDDLKKLLKDNEIKFFNGAKTEKLLELCINNKLV